ncbi:RidA family protein [Alishewanella jeotgali]|uniref:Endoribonuclease L-PSP n=1 Tax=Alishewanella jeotgali KCTC 22429 TaxID=1129374 RepID=H3ZE90_9ALTE|nr:RidA family protein [Alishewanella jeotgali]EHR41134.1 endoribonuclease L-PSP [Alishewanella jeotgali KCTC 22429]
MSIQHIDPTVRYSEAVITNGLIFCAGMVPDTSATDIKSQTENVLSQIDALLERCFSHKRKLVDVTIFLADMADYAAMNQVWDAWLVEGAAPARTTVAAKLADPHWKIEIKVVAAQ